MSGYCLSPFSWQCQNLCLLSLAFITYWRVVLNLDAKTALKQGHTCHIWGRECSRDDSRNGTYWSRGQRGRYQFWRGRPASEATAAVTTTQSHGLKGRYGWVWVGALISRPTTPGSVLSDSCKIEKIWIGTQNLCLNLNYLNCNSHFIDLINGGSSFLP